MVRAALKPSARLAAIIVAIHAASLCAITPLDLGIALKAALALLVAASLVRCTYENALLRTRRSVVAIEIRDQCFAAVETRKHGWRSARILNSTCVTSALTVLNLRVDGERITRHVLLVNGNVDADPFRRIRVLLRWSRHRQEADAIASRS